jgi:hypothetical protein
MGVGVNRLRGKKREQFEYYADFPIPHAMSICESEPVPPSNYPSCEFCINLY